MDSTGNTHGIRFKIKPPKIDIKKIKIIGLLIFINSSSIDTFFTKLKLWFLSYNNISNGKLSFEN